MSEVRVEARRTKSDIFQGILANTLRSPGALAWCGGGAFVVAAIAVAVNQGETAVNMLIIGAVALVAMLVFYSLLSLFCILLAARMTWRSTGALDAITYTFSEAGLGVDAPTGHGLTSWSTWKTAFETKSLIVLRHELNLIHIVPKRGLASDALNRVRGVLNAQIKSARLTSDVSEPAA